jgi:hypothetical protein
MKKALELMIFVFVVTLLAGYSAAAQGNDQPVQPTAPQDRVSPTEEANAKTEQQPITLKIQGAALRDNADAAIGRIEDLIVDPESGRIEFVVAMPYYPTNNTKLRAIPWKAIKFQGEQKSLTRLAASQVFMLNFPRTKLQQAPAFEYHRWPDMSQSAWRQQIYSYYSIQNEPATGGTGNESQSTAGSDKGETKNPARESQSRAGAERGATKNPAPTNPDFIGPPLPPGSGQ